MGIEKIDEHNPHKRDEDKSNQHLPPGVYDATVDSRGMISVEGKEVGKVPMPDPFVGTLADVGHAKAVEAKLALHQRQLDKEADKEKFTRMGNFEADAAMGKGSDFHGMTGTRKLDLPPSEAELKAKETDFHTIASKRTQTLDEFWRRAGEFADGEMPPEPEAVPASFGSLTADDYQQATAKTAIYPGQGTLLGLIYCALKLNGEAGELAEHIGKAIRDDGAAKVNAYVPHGNAHISTTTLTSAKKLLLLKECGDVAWYLARICSELGEDLSFVLAMNLDKLNDRKARGKLGGTGDER